HVGCSLTTDLLQQQAALALRNPSVLEPAGGDPCQNTGGTGRSMGVGMSFDPRIESKVSRIETPRRFHPLNVL
ncbi:MAG TPA: hypothetical protein VK208_16460, partial [Pyrinomonadaceae bacterium]|nr:hypothetical protein [Pyrinomonadaceae bacterium]